MVLGDIVAANADDNQGQQRQMEQSAVGNSSTCAQCRTAHDDEEDDDTDSETDEDSHGVQHIGPLDPRLVTLRWSCNDGASTSTERR